MTAKNYDDALAQLREHGLIVDHLELNRKGEFTRGPVKGHRDRKKGWTQLHEVRCDSGSGSLIWGAYGIWQGNDPGTQHIVYRKGERPDPKDKAEAERLNREGMKRHLEQRANEARIAANKAAQTWSRLSIDGESPYLRAKGVRGHGVRYENGVAVVPLLNTQGHIQALQYLRSKGQAEALGDGMPTKQILPKGAAKQGHYHLIGPEPVGNGGYIVIAEGYVTAATIHEATGAPVVMAVDAGNLEHVAKALAKKYKGRVQMIFAADDDRWQKCNACGTALDLQAVDGFDCPSCGKHHRATNVGIQKATEVATRYGGRVAAPCFKDPEALFALYQATGEKITDWNDLAQREGLPAVREQWSEHLIAAGVKASTPIAGNSSTSGGGDGEKLANFLDVEELLGRFALVYNHGSTVFDRQERVLMTLSDLRDACADGKLVRAWQASQNREVVRIEEVGFDPTEADPKIRCNLFRGWPTEPLDAPLEVAENKCRNLTNGLLWLCGGDEALFAWVMRWLALPLQKPGSKMKSAIVVHGPQGTGKSTFFEAVARIYGPYSRVLNQDAMEDKHNDWASRMLFAIADEVVARSEVWHVKNKLKGLITGDSIRINPKHMRAYDERNFCNLVFLSNEIQPVALDQDDRRHLVIWTPDKLEKSFYDAMHEEVNGDGIAALHRVLLEFPLDGFRTSTEPPMTSAKRDLMEMSADNISMFARDLLDGSILGTPPRPMLSVDAYRLYRWWCTQQGVRDTSQIKFTNFLAKKHGATSVKTRWVDDAGRPSVSPQAVLLWAGQQAPEANKAEWFGRQILDARQRIDAIAGAKS